VCSTCVVRVYYVCSTCAVRVYYVCTMCAVRVYYVSHKLVRLECRVHQMMAWCREAASVGVFFKSRVCYFRRVHTCAPHCTICACMCFPCCLLNLVMCTACVVLRGVGRCMMSCCSTGTCVASENSDAFQKLPSVVSVTEPCSI
jgi:hypothetical protein